MYIVLHIKFYLPTPNFLDMFKNPEIPNFMKIRPVELSCSMLTDRESVKTKPTATFHNFANALKIAEIFKRVITAL